MIYVSALALVAKKAFDTKCFQTSVSNIIDSLPIDPSISGMDVVMLSHRDATGINGVKLQAAIDHKHEDVTVIYIYDKDKNKDLINCECKKFVKKITTDALIEVRQEFLSDKAILESTIEIDRKDTKASEVSSESEAKHRRQRVEKFSYSEPEPEPTPEPASEPEPFNLEPIEEVIPEPAAPTESETVVKMEDMLSSISNYKDWNLFMEQMNKDVVTRKLIEENTEFMGIIQMLEVLDQQILAVWRDTALSAEQKFNKIKEIGISRSNLRGKANNINTNKVLSIIETVCMSAKRTVEEKISEIQESMSQLVVNKNQLFDTTELDAAISRRTELQLELMDIMKGVIELYKSMDLLVTDEIRDLADRLPSDNRFINEMVKPIGSEIFTPANTGELATRLMKALQDNRVTMSQLEESIKGIIAIIFRMFEADNEIHMYHENMINLLKANKVEDLVLRDSLLKDALRIFTGLEETGLTATVLVSSYVQSRKQNTLVIDIDGTTKFERYGVSFYELEDFMERQIREHFVCVRAGITDLEDLQELVSKLKGVLQYYPVINLVIRPDKAQAIEQLSEDALSITYVTDCKEESLNTIKESIAMNDVQNIARKIVMIDVPVSPLVIANMLGIDPTITKIITLPNLTRMKFCAIKHDRPYEYENISLVFEEALA